VNRTGHLDHQAADPDHAAVNIDTVDVADLFGKSLHKVVAFVIRGITVKALSFATFLNGA
jgi:hypothetical protein